MTYLCGLLKRIRKLQGAPFISVAAHNLATYRQTPVTSPNAVTASRTAGGRAADPHARAARPRRTLPPARQKRRAGVSAASEDSAVLSPAVGRETRQVVAPPIRVPKRRDGADGRVPGIPASWCAVRPRGRREARVKRRGGSTRAHAVAQLFANSLLRFRRPK
jgi:hypothetical protein